MALIEADGLPERKASSMVDRTTKTLLAVIAVLLTAILFRLLMPDVPVQAQSSSSAALSVPVMAVDDNMVYILQNGRLSAYYLDSAQLRTALPQVATEKWHHLDTIPLSDQK